jgi:hypothetical protein
VNVVADLTIDALRAYRGEDWPHYRHALIAACKKVPPPFGTKSYGDIYRDAALDPYWMAVSLVRNAHREGEGAGQLWDLAACTPDAHVAEQITQHAIDESGHARAYLAMLDLTFPDAVNQEFRTQLATLSPGYTRQSARRPHDGSPFAHPVTMDELIQMNIAEIRTRVHHLLQRPMLVAYCPPERRGRLEGILDILLADETRHIAYTAALIDEFARVGHADSVGRIMQDRLSDFNTITVNDLGRQVFEST